MIKQGYSKIKLFGNGKMTQRLKLIFFMFHDSMNKT